MGDSLNNFMKPAALMQQRSSTGSSAAWNRTTVDTSKSKREQLQGVAKEFEAAFLAEFLKQGRAGELAEGMFSSEAGKTFQGMLDVEIARASSGGLNLGIADAMVKQLGRGLPKEVK